MALIYHLAPAERWNTWPDGQAYLPAEYEADGFIHCTAGDELMLLVANRFYSSTPGVFMMLTIDTEKVTAPVLWEAASHPTPGALDTGNQLFPHIYGLIDAAAILEARQVRRAADGRFIGW